MPEYAERLTALAAEVEPHLKELPLDAQKALLTCLKMALLPAQWLTEHGGAVAAARVTALECKVEVNRLEGLVGSKLDMQAMTALHDDTMTDGQKIDALTRALYSLLGEHHLILLAARQLLEPASKLDVESRKAQEAIAAFRLFKENPTPPAQD